MTLTTNEELKHLASSDNANELTRRLARECLANREAQPVALVDRRPAASGGICWQHSGKDLAHGTELFTSPPAPEITDEAIDRIVVPLSPDGLDEEKHHCEWHLYHDRERIRKELREYFAAPPAPTVSDDTRRMDWLVAHHVAVRKPLRYGSEAMFTAQTITDEEDDYHATKLREQIDAAMVAAAPEGGNDHDTRR